MCISTSGTLPDTLRPQLCTATIGQPMALEEYSKFVWTGPESVISSLAIKTTDKAIPSNVVFTQLCIQLVTAVTAASRNFKWQQQGYSNYIHNEQWSSVTLQVGNTKCRKKSKNSYAECIELRKRLRPRSSHKRKWETEKWDKRILYKQSMTIKHWL